jgi:hypothetical protein
MIRYKRVLGRNLGGFAIDMLVIIIVLIVQVFLIIICVRQRSSAPTILY